jgi:nucleoside-diphosphate-sugar epimerase
MNKHIKIVVIGGRGLIGTRLVNNLRQQGQEIVAASPSSNVNTITNEGFSQVVVEDVK